MRRRFVALSTAAAAAVVLSGALSPSASAQTAPYTAYGLNQRAGAMVAANIAGRSCGDPVTVTVTGTWLMSIPESAACAPRQGDVVSFTVDGAPADQTITWSPGGAPANPAVGISLTVTPRATTGTFTGSIAASGVSIVAFTGTTAQLNTAGAAAKAVSVSATVSGKMLTFVVGAPSFVNTDFNSAFSGGLNGALVVVKT